MAISSFSPVSFPFFAFDPLRNLELIISMTLRLVWVFNVGFVCFRINLALIDFTAVYEYMSL